MGRERLTITEEEIDGIVVFHLYGKIVGGPQTDELCARIKELSEAGKMHFVLDFLNVKWMDSMGMGAIISALTTLRNHGGDLRLANVAFSVKKYFEITRLDKVLQLFDSVHAAVQSYQSDED